MKTLGSLLAKREKVMKSVLRLRLESIRDAVREREKTVTLPRCDLDVLIDAVETTLAGQIVHGYNDRQEFMALKRCRSELRAAMQ